MLEARVLRSLWVATDAGPRHLSAASGLAQVGQRLYVVADDEHELGTFGLMDEGPGALRRLFAGDLPQAHKARKAAKPDFETLVPLPPMEGHAQGALLALGSGSRPQRRRGALMGLDGAGELQGAVREIDLAPLYEPLRARHALLNIEGAFVSGGSFCLLQRGNAKAPANVLIAYDWPAVHAWLGGAAPAPEPVSSTAYELGGIDGVPLCFTDGAALPGGGWVFCAAAEATDDNYADGACRGSAVGVVAADGRLRALLPLSPACKAEGITARVESGALHLLLVTDADDRSAAALLLSAQLRDPRP